MNMVAMNARIDRIAGHIRQPYTLAQIVRQIESNEYSAEMMLQHLLRWVAANVPARNRQGDAR
jgi:hypothetical protein